MLCHPGVCYSDRWAVALVDSGPSSSKEACERSVRGGWATEWFVFTCGGVHLWSTRFYCRLFPFIFSRQLSGLRGSTMVHTHSSSHPHPVGLSSLQLSTHRRRFYPQQKDDLLCSSPLANCKQIRFSPMDSRPSSPDRPHLQPNRAPKWSLIRVGPHISSCFLLFRCRL